MSMICPICDEARNCEDCLATFASKPDTCEHGFPLHYACDLCIESWQSTPFTKQERIDEMVGMIQTLMRTDDDAPLAWGLEVVFRHSCRYEATVCELEERSKALEGALRDELMSSYRSESSQQENEREARNCGVLGLTVDELRALAAPPPEPTEESDDG